MYSVYYKGQCVEQFNTYSECEEFIEYKVERWNYSYDDFRIIKD